MKNNQIQQPKAFLYNRKLAWIITIVVIIAAMFFGVGRSVNGIRQETVTIFEKGNDGTGKGITYEVKQIQDNAWNFLEVGERYLAAESELLKSLENACNNLKDEKSPSVIYENVDNIMILIEDIYDELETLEMRDTDVNYLAKLYTNIQSSFRVSQLSSYNDEAIKFNQLIKKMPTRIFNVLIRIKPLELYQ